MRRESTFYEASVECLVASPFFEGLSRSAIEEMVGLCRRETWKRRRMLPME